VQPVFTKKGGKRDQATKTSLQVPSLRFMMWLRSPLSSSCDETPPSPFLTFVRKLRKAARSDTTDHSMSSLSVTRAS
jgi:hypothetical protein